MHDEISHLYLLVQGQVLKVIRKMQVLRCYLSKLCTCHCLLNQWSTYSFFYRPIILCGQERVNSYQSTNAEKLTLHEKLYFPGPGISWTVQKAKVDITFASTLWLKKTVFPITEMFKTRTFWQPITKNFQQSVNIIFPSSFCLKKDRISHYIKVQNQNFLVISKYQLFINFLPQKRPHFPFPKSSKQKFFSNQYISYFCHFFGSKKPVYSIPQKFKIRALQQSVKMIFHAKENITFLFFFFGGLKHNLLIH